MLKKVIIFFLLELYLVSLFLPGLPLLHYYLFACGNQTSQLTQTLHFENNKDAVIGDAVYLKALIKRVQEGDVTKKAQNQPPRTNLETSNLVCIQAELYQKLQYLKGITICFADYSEKPLSPYRRVILPPPNFA